MKKIFKLILILFTFSCGFNSLSLEVTKLPPAEVRVNKNEPIAFILKEEIEDILNAQEQTYKYIINISYDFSESVISLNSGGSPNRILINLNIKYELIDKKKGQKIAKGSLDSNDIIEIGDNKFANYESKEFSKKTMVRNCARRIINYLLKDIKFIKY